MSPALTPDFSATLCGSTPSIFTAIASHPPSSAFSAPYRLRPHTVFSKKEKGAHGRVPFSPLFQNKLRIFLHDCSAVVIAAIAANSCLLYTSIRILRSGGIQQEIYIGDITRFHKRGKGGFQRNGTRVIFPAQMRQQNPLRAAPVSYTHLDVYKRQFHFHGKGQRFRLHFTAPISSNRNI